MKERKKEEKGREIEVETYVLTC